MRLEQDSHRQFNTKNNGRRPSLYFQSETSLKVLLDEDVEYLQKLLSGSRVYQVETNAPLTKVCKSLLLHYATYVKAIKSNPALTSSFQEKGKNHG